jgi:hypothetical protein
MLDFRSHPESVCWISTGCQSELFQRKRPLKPSGLEVHLCKIFIAESHQRSLAGVQNGDVMGRLDIEPAIKQDDVASCRD